MQFSVTDKWIRNGLVESYTHNPIALAIKHTLKKERNAELKVEIFQRDYVFIDGHLFPLPKQAQVLLHRFHGKKQVQQIVFELNIPDDLFAEAMF